MLEGSVMEVVKWWIYLILLFFALALFMFFFQTNQTNRFEGYVNTQIERYAGLTPQAVANIKMESENYYGGRYRVVLDEEKTQTNVDYTATAETEDPLNVTYEVDGEDVEMEVYNTVMDQPLQFGDVVAYDVVATYPIMFGWMDPIDITTSGEAIIQVRGSAGIE